MTAIYNTGTAKRKPQAKYTTGRQTHSRNLSAFGIIAQSLNILRRDIPKVENTAEL